MKREVVWVWSVQLVFLWVVTTGTDIPEDGGIKLRSKCGSSPTELHAVTRRQ